MELEPAQADGAFDVARAYYAQRGAVSADRLQLDRLIEAVAFTNDLTPYQWAQWYTTALAFQPDLILELGRGRGNSTALFCQAVNRLGHGVVVSLCASEDWELETRPRLARVVPPEWFARVHALRGNILEIEYGELLAAAHRVLVLWDAHGFEIAEVVLGRILPQLVGKAHLVLMHDISDNRYAGVSRAYDGAPLWKGQGWQARSGEARSRVNIGWMNSAVDQVIAIADFCARNRIELGSADHAYHTFFGENPERAEEMQALLGDRFFSRLAHWAYLSLNERRGPFTFPGQG